MGLLHVVENDDQLAAVLRHDDRHALAHHVSERIANEHPQRSALAFLRGKAFDREQEAEADHIGVFLMTFANYDPEQAVHLWERIERISASRTRIPEILSDHPSDERRLKNIARWVPYALAAKRAYEEGRIEPDAEQARASRPLRREIREPSGLILSSFTTNQALRQTD